MWFELTLAAVLVSLYLAFWAWHSQGRGKLTQAEIDQYVAIIEKLPLPKKAVQAFIARLRPWAEADDGNRSICSTSSTSSPGCSHFPARRISRERPNRPTHVMKRVSYGCG